MKISIITGSRAEFHILKNLIFALKKDKKIKTNLVVTGSHLSSFFGNTINEINDQKIKITSKIDLSIKKDQEKNIANSISLGVNSFSRLFKKNKPDLLLILGDRYEIFSAAISACVNRVPIVHIHGGERTAGLIDEGIRHSITKLSHIHFVSTNIYYNRVKQLGENKKFIFNVGSLGVEATKKTKLLNKNELEKVLNIKFQSKNIIVTFHSETLKTSLENKKNFKILLSALGNLKNTSIIFTMPNADLDFKMIVKEIKKFIKLNKNSYFFKSLGHKKYFSLCKQVDLMIGNSSSGIIEMPSFKKGTINIGDRQGGRVKADSIIDSKFNKKEIIKKINYVYSKKFGKILKKMKNPYEKKNTSKKILKIIKKINLKNILIKDFFDYKLR
tara:strand:- start:101 stop:1261 length:1161 start_codon:yes stop_codon:yes gene_type:complete